MDAIHLYRYYRSKCRFPRWKAFVKAWSICFDDPAPSLAAYIAVAAWAVACALYVAHRMRVVVW